MEQRIADRIQVDLFTGCHRWMGAKDRDGYGTVSVGGKTRRVHRYVWEEERGPIPAKQVLDHVRARGCLYRDCCNCEHLEPVTVTVNSQRVVPWNRVKTHCPSGHDYEEYAAWYVCKDGYVRRFCRECQRERKARGRRMAA